MMIKVCFITTIYETFRTFIKPLSEYLYSSGEYEISLICNDEPIAKTDLPSFVHYYPVSMKRGIDFFGIFVVNRLKMILQQNKFDIVQYSTPNASLYASIAAKKSRVPVRLYCQWGIRYVSIKGFSRYIFKSIEKFVCKNSTWIEPDSYGNLEFSRSEGLYNASKSSVLGFGSAKGVDLYKFDIKQKEKWNSEIRLQYNIGKNNIVICFVGRITVEKGFNEFLSAAKEITKKYSFIKFLIVGENERGAGINKEKFLWSKEAANIIYCGKSENVEKFMAASDVFVLPSYREGFGSVVIEAEAMGVPVIVTNIPGPIEAIQPGITGLVVEKGDVLKLKAAMEDLINDREKRETMGHAGRKLVEERFEQKYLFSIITEDRKRLFNNKYIKL